jgi:hypothetical protein
MLGRQQAQSRGRLGVPHASVERARHRGPAEELMLTGSGEPGYDVEVIAPSGF